jgi:hypothetical protein
MPIIDLNTGEMTDEQPIERNAQTVKQPVKSQQSGIVNLETGDYESNATPINQQEGNSALNSLVDSVGPVDSALISAGKTVADLGRFVGIGEEESAIERQALSQLREARPITTAVGQALPFVVPGVGVANIASLPTRVLAAGSLGAAEGATIAAGTDKDIFKASTIGALVGSGLELAFPVIGRIGGALFRRITGRPPTAPIVDSFGEPSREFSQALEKRNINFSSFVDSAGANPQLDEFMEARRVFLEENNITPTRAQVTGDATDFQSQQELAKVSGRVRSSLEVQENALTNKFNNAITQTGGTANPSNSPVFDFVADKAIDLDAAISSAYKSAREMTGETKIVKADELIKELRKMGGTNQASNGVASAVRSFIKDKGIITGKKLETDARFSASVAESLRQDINSLYASSSDFGRQQLAKLKNALDNDVARDVGQDTFAEARSMKAKFESDLNRAKVNKFDRRNTNLLRNILENKISPETFLDDAILRKSVRSTDIQQVKDYLLLDENPAGVAAWNDLRAEAMQRIASVAMPEVAGQGALSRASMEKIMGRFGANKLKVLFNPEEMKFLNSMLQISKIREPVRMTQQGRGPSAQAVERLAQAMERIPLVADSFRGAAQRVANNQALELPEPIRNKLLRSIQPAAGAGITSGAVQTQQQEQE